MGFKSTDKTTQALLLSSCLPGDVLGSVSAKNETTGHYRVAFSFGLNTYIGHNRTPSSANLWEHMRQALGSPNCEDGPKRAPFCCYSDTQKDIRYSLRQRMRLEKNSVFWTFFCLNKFVVPLWYE